MNYSRSLRKSSPPPSSGLVLVGASSLSLTPRGASSTGALIPVASGVKLGGTVVGLLLRIRF